MEAALANKPKDKSQHAAVAGDAPGANHALSEAGASAGMPLFLQGAMPASVVSASAPSPHSIAASQPDDRFEREAESAAEQILHIGAPPTPQRAAAPVAAHPSHVIRGSGQPLDAGTRAFLEPRLRQDFSAVRVHTDGPAAASARALDAAAYTTGRDIVFGAGKYAPHSAQGQRLLAHELTHVVQQGGGPSTPASQALAPQAQIQRQPRTAGWDPSAAVADFDLPQDTMDPLSTEYVAEPVVVSFPLLPGEQRSGRREDDRQTVYIHSAIISNLPISMFAVPIARVSLTPPPPGAAAAAAVAPPPPLPAAPTQTAPTPAPPAATTTSGNAPSAAPAPPVAAPLITPASNPDFPRGTTIYTPDGQSFTVEFSTADHVVVNRITKYAVGAGSCNLVETNGGLYLMDAGANLNVSPAVSVALADYIAQRAAGRPIRGAYVTHAHADHTSIIETVMSRVPILEIGVNPMQTQHRTWQQAVPEWIAAQQQWRANERNRIFNDAAERAAFEANLRAGLTPDQTLDTGNVDRLWNAEVDLRMAQIPATQVTTMVQGPKGVLDTLNTRPLDPTTGGRAPAAGETAFGDAELIAFGDPALARTAPLRESETDKLSSSYLLSIEGGPTFLVLPDLREPDFAALRRHFTEAVRQLGVRSSFQVWDVLHHMQIGATGRPTGTVAQHGQDVTGGSQNVRGSTVRATALQNLLQTLHDFRSPRGPQGQRGSDAAMSSVDANKVEVGTVNLLRALGFEVYLNTAPAATPGGQDAAATNVLDIVTATGGRVTGIQGRPQGRPGQEASLERAHLARDQMNADARLLRQRIARETDAAAKTRLQSQESDIQGRIRELHQLELAYIQEVDRVGSRGLNTPQPAQEPGLAQRQAIDAWLNRNNVPPLVTSDMHLTDAALILIRRDPGAEPPAGTPEAARRANGRAIAELQSRINARVRALNSGMIERIGASPAAEQLRLYGDLEELNTRLTTEIDATQPGTSRRILEDLRTHTQEQIRLYVPPETPSTPSRLPTGELVETRVVAVRQPDEAPAGEPAPSPTAQKLLAANEVLGRGMGGVMVITSIRGEASLIDRYEQAQAGAGELAVGTARNVGGAVVGVRMVSGMRVGAGVFIVLSALDVAEAMLRPYESEREQNIEVTYATINAAVSVACMYAGEALIATLNPIGIVAGVAVMFLGPRLLEVFGLHNWLERQMSFLPSDIVGLHQDLRDQLEQYRATIGNLELARRDAQEMRDVGAADAPALQQEARQREQEHRAHATAMEPDILDKFETAYAEARTSYAGLRELDAWRREFLLLQRRASPAGENADEADMRNQMMPELGGRSEAYRTPQERAMDRFAQIESTLSMDNMSAEDIHGMEQWWKIHDACTQVADRLPINGGEGDWKSIREKSQEMQAMLDNARYRIAPGSMGDFRTTPFLKPGTPARAAYEQELAQAERHVALTQSMMAEAAAGTLQAGDDRGWPAMRLWGPEANNLTDYQLLASAEAGLATYKNRLDAMPTLPEQFMHPVAVPPTPAGPATPMPGTVPSVSAPDQPAPTPASPAADPLFRDSGVARVAYPEYIRTNEGYRTALTRLQVLEETLQGQIEQVQRVIAPPGFIGPLSVEQIAQRQRLHNLVTQFRAARADRAERRGLLFPEEASRRAEIQGPLEVDFYARALGAREGARPLNAEEIAALRTGEHGKDGERISGAVANRLAAIPDLRRPDSQGRLTGIMRLDDTGSGPYKLVGILKLTTVAGNPVMDVNALNAPAIQALGGAGVHKVTVNRLSTAWEADLTP